MNERGRTTDFEPEIVVLYCQHSVAQDASITLHSERTSGFAVRSTMIPCSRKVEIPHVPKILEQGADGVELVACPEDKCRFLVGSLMAEKRVERARGALDEIGMGADRVGLSRSERLSAEGLIGLAEARATAVKPLGPNPMDQGEGK